MIEKVAKGIYIDSAKIEDVYYVLSVSTPKIIYSHMTYTALTLTRKHNTV